jgi:hypothetical protein
MGHTSPFGCMKEPKVGERMTSIPMRLSCGVDTSVVAKFLLYIPSIRGSVIPRASADKLPRKYLPGTQDLSAWRTKMSADTGFETSARFFVMVSDAAVDGCAIT